MSSISLFFETCPKCGKAKLKSSNACDYCAYIEGLFSTPGPGEFKFTKAEPPFVYVKEKSSYETAYRGPDWYSVQTPLEKGLPGTPSWLRESVRERMTGIPSFARRDITKVDFRPL